MPAKGRLSMTSRFNQDEYYSEVAETFAVIMTYATNTQLSLSLYSVAAQTSSLLRENHFRDKTVVRIPG